MDDDGAVVNSKRALIAIAVGLVVVGLILVGLLWQAQRNTANKARLRDGMRLVADVMRHPRPHSIGRTPPEGLRTVVVLASINPASQWVTTEPAQIDR